MQTTAIHSNKEAVATNQQQGQPCDKRLKDDCCRCKNGRDIQKRKHPSDTQALVVVVTRGRLVFVSAAARRRA
jgi:hypothetical protein